MYWVYILECADGSYYTGITTDLERRLQEHQQGLPKGARYTHSRRPVKVLWQQSQPDRISASRLEYQIKRMSRQQKLNWIARNP